MNRRLVLAGVAGAAVLGTVVPALAQPTLPKVTVTQQDGGVFVGVSQGGEPVAGVGSTSQGICAGLGEDIPVCVPVTTSIQPPPSPATRQKLPVVVYHDDTRTAVGVGDVGVVVYSDGEICPVVSTQDWPCVRTSLN